MIPYNIESLNCYAIELSGSTCTLSLFDTKTIHPNK